MLLLSLPSSLRSAATAYACFVHDRLTGPLSSAGNRTSFSPLNSDLCTLISNELKNSTIKILYSLPTIIHLGEDFSNLSRTQHSTMSTPSGCTNVAAYVPCPGDQVIHNSSRRDRAQATGRIRSNSLQCANFTPGTTLVSISAGFSFV